MSSPYVPEGMNYTPFTSPYQEWHDGEEGATPITAQILNYNYDRYLNLLNTFCSDVRTNINKIPDVIPENLVVDASYVHTDNNFTTALKTKLDNLQIEGNPILPVGPTIEMEELETLQINEEYFKITHSGGGGSAPTDGTFYKRTNTNYGISITYNSSIPSVYSATITKYIDGTQTDSVTLGYSDLVQNIKTKTLDDLKITYDGNSNYDNKTYLTVITNKVIEHGSSEFSEFYDNFAAVNSDTCYIVLKGHASEVEGNVDRFVENGCSYIVTVSIESSIGVINIKKYGGKSLIDESTTSVASGSYADLSNIRVSFNGTKFTISSKMDYIKYNSTLAGNGDDICELTPASGDEEVASFINEGTLATAVGDLTNIKIDDKIFTIPSGGSGSSTLSGLSDVTITSPSNGQILTYDSSTSKWVNSSSSLYTDVTGTLTAGSTSITLSDNSITSSSTIEVFNDLDVPYNSKTVTTGSITLTFDAQQSNMSVKVRVS